MYKILTLNNISLVGLERLPRDKYEIASEMMRPDAILLRSHNMHGMEIPDSVKAVARAGAGVNNIPVTELSALGIPVFNAPGANASAVRGLVVAAMFLACRNICQAWDFARNLEGSDDAIHAAVEAGKKRFVGFELGGHTLGVVGLGAIGVKVANTALKLGMNVYGYDPDITVNSAWKLSSEVQQAASVDHLFSQVDFVSFHVPSSESTYHMLNAERINLMKPGVVVINFARPEIVDENAILEAIDGGKIYSYVCDFPSNRSKNHEKVIALPHIGASTREAEENCAIMVAEQLKNFLENGDIRNSVNFPNVVMPRTRGMRIAVANSNVPNMVGQISTALAKANLNIIDLINKSRGDIAYTLADVEGDVPQDVFGEIRSIQGVLSVRIV